MLLPMLRNGLILFLFTLGLYLFGRGFFLHRNVVQSVSACGDVKDFYKTASEQCWSARRYRRAIILVIDALKYEFSIPNDLDYNWSNKLPIFERLKYRYPKQTFHARFVADSPTTTLQRLSALLTGSMPTFIDAATNFYQTSINEDNLIRQMRENDLRVVFMGDDTWMSLLPGHFLRSYPYPSFVVNDLHTVDNGVISHIYDELAAPDVDVLIGHFLGVDHCGHWHHQDHPEMAAKLSQMNEVISNVTEKLMEGDLLIVLGDHGMTLSGDHGGNTEDETSATLFMYSPGSEPLLKQNLDPNEEKRVSQIDLVPTLSLLLGVPIPFSSLGYLIEPLFISKPAQSTELDVLWMNVQQVHRYIKSSPHLSKLTQKGFNQLDALWNVVQLDPNSTLAANSFHKAAKEYLEKVQTVARSAFTIFSIPLMGLGVIHLIVSCGTAIWAMLNDVLAGAVNSPLEEKERNVYYWTTILTTLVACFGPFSNSFVINEDQASLYLLQGILLLVAVANRHCRAKLSAVLVIMFAFRFLSVYGWICRYEQGCKFIEEDLHSNFWTGLSSIAILATCLAVHLELKRAFQQDLAKSLAAQIIGLLFYVGSFALVAFWFLDSQGDEKLKGLALQRGYLPNLSFACFSSLHLLLCAHRKLVKDRVILRLNYVLIHGVAFCNILCIFTSVRHVPALQLMNLCLLGMHVVDIVPEELQGVLGISLMTATFFMTGHQNTFQQLQWKMGFIGFSGASLVFPAVKVLLNTFSAQILFAFLMPSVLLRRSPRSVSTALVVLKVTSQCIACFALRHHLMLWAVFATRLLYSIVESAVMIVGVMLGSFACRNSAYWNLERMGLLNAEMKVKKKEKL